MKQAAAEAKAQYLANTHKREYVAYSVRNGQWMACSKTWWDMNEVQVQWKMYRVFNPNHH